MSKKKAIIIGSGVGGLATAIRLASKGFEVEVFEKNDYVGGKLSAFEKNGFFFDAGPSLFTAPQFMEDLFKEANEPIAEYFSYKKLPIACKYFYEDGTEVNAYTNNEAFADELTVKLKEDKTVVSKYLKTSDKLFNKTGTFFINNSLQKIKNYFSNHFLQAFKGVKFSHLTQNLNKYNTAHFNNEKTVQLFNRFATYNGSNPYKASAMLSLIAHLEHNDGTYYPKGGMISITNALHQLALKKGVVFHLNSPVERIIAHDKKVTGIVVNGENCLANVVVSNADVYFTHKNLLRNFEAANKVLKQERSSSAFIFYWGINRNFDQLELHNILFSENYKQEFESIFKHKSIYQDPTIYINITSKIEPETQAPKGKENWFVMVNVPSNKSMDWDVAAKEYKAVVIKKINSILKTDISACIETESILHPQIIEDRTASYAGSLYGSSSNAINSAFLRQANYSKNYKGLYFVGGSVHPGGGIPLCLKSAEIVSKMV
jgi:phytoene desaturase